MRNTLTLALLLSATTSAAALEMARLRVQRKEVFEFTQKPRVRRKGDRVTITFAVKDYCDATVAIEDDKGRIVRYLASGVLGKNAPAPLRKNSLNQTLEWDGKNELGKYVARTPEEYAGYAVRVSLGLRARMERTLFWSGQKRAAGRSNQLMRATPKGVYVLSPGVNTQLRLYDHDGNYVRTIYPFPRNKIEEVKGLKWREFPPDNERLPSKLYGHDQNCLLPDRPAGRNHRGWAGMTMRYEFDLLTRAMDVREDRIVLAGGRLMLLATDGSSGGVDLAGSVVERPPRNSFALPNSVAISPDGSKAYLTGYYLARSGQGFSSLARAWHQDVNVVDLATGKISRFAGSPDGVRLPKGADNAHFRYPMSVACDSRGRVYVADNLNNRIQVYLPDGKFFKTVPVKRPGIVRVDPGNGELWVRSSNIGYAGRIDARIGHANFWDKTRAPQVLTHLGPVDNPKVKATYRMPAGMSWERGTWFYDQYVEVDFHTDPPTVWASGNPQDKRAGARIRLFQPKNGKLVCKRDFGVDAKKALADPKPSRFGRPRIAANPVNGHLYVGLGGVSHHEVVIVDPETGRVKGAPLPTDAEDFAFDLDGGIYLRTYNAVTRFDPRTWREIPYDYGTARVVRHGGNGFARAKRYKAISALDLPSGGSDGLHLGGFGVAADGTIVAACINPRNPSERKRVKDRKIHQSAGRPYMAPVYPGRTRGQEAHIFDVHGKLLKDDAVPGIGRATDVEIDRQGNVYLLAASAPYLDGKPYFNGRGCTLIKIKPGKMKGLAAAKAALPLPDSMRPKRAPDMTRPGIWVQGAEWLFGPVGAEGHYGSGGKCQCFVTGRFTLDYFARSFAPEVDRFRVVVLDTNGNVILRIGRYGNVDDGMPLVKSDPARTSRQGGQPPHPRAIGGDETAIMHAQAVAVHTDRRLFVADSGNQCVRSVRLGYHATERVALRDVPDEAAKQR
jgi:DNA-binding beta-propeller fold protein YncE